MRSYLKTSGKLPVSARSQYSREPGEWPRLARKEITAAELACALRLDIEMTKAITSSRTFPPAIGVRAGSPLWKLADVATWLRSAGWASDATALERW